jgi:hypothetical protein
VPIFCAQVCREISDIVIKGLDEQQNTVNSVTGVDCLDSNGFLRRSSVGKTISVGLGWAHLCRNAGRSIHVPEFALESDRRGTAG